MVKLKRQILVERNKNAKLDNRNFKLVIEYRNNGTLVRSQEIMMKKMEFVKLLKSIETAKVKHVKRKRLSK